MKRLLSVLTICALWSRFAWAAQPSLTAVKATPQRPTHHHAHKAGKHPHPKHHHNLV